MQADLGLDLCDVWDHWVGLHFVGLSIQVNLITLSMNINWYNFGGKCYEMVFSYGAFTLLPMKQNLIQGSNPKYQNAFYIKVLILFLHY